MAGTSSTPITAHQQLLDLINHDNNTSLTLEDVTFSLPTPVSLNNRNTRVTITASGSGRFEGSKDVFYNRLALSQLGHIGIITADALTSDEFLQIVSTRKGIDLLAEELETVAIPVLEAGELGQIVLTAKPTAVKWYGQITADIAFGVPPVLDAIHQLVHVTLSAPDYLV